MTHGQNKENFSKTYTGVPCDLHFIKCTYLKTTPELRLHTRIKTTLELRLPQN